MSHNPRDFFGRRVRKIILQCKKEDKMKEDDLLNISYFSDRNATKSRKLFWALALLVTFSLFSYHAYERVQYFLLEPTGVVVSFADETIINEYMPQFSVCRSKVELNEPQTSQAMCITIEDLLQRQQPLPSVWDFINITDAVGFYYNNEPQEYLKDLLQWRQVPFPDGTCVTLNFDKFKVRILDNFELRINRLKSCEEKGWLRVYYAEEEEALNFKSLFPWPGYATVSEFESITQFYHSNRKHKPCVSQATYVQCLQNHLRNRIPLKCRFPFLDNVYGHLPLCQPNYNTINDYKAGSKTFSSIAKKMNIKCIRSCQERFHMFSLSSREKTQNYSSLKFHVNPNVKIITEVLIFDTISLCCEFGGLLGLYFGCSVLSIFTLPMYLSRTNFMTRKGCYLRTRDVISEKTRRLYYSEKLGRYQRLDTHRNILDTISKALKSLVFYQYFLVGLFFVILASERLYYFSTNPTSITVDINTRETFILPTITYCKNSESFLRLQNAYMKEKDLVSESDMSTIDLIGQKFENFTLTADDLWSNLSYQKMTEPPVSMTGANF